MNRTLTVSDSISQAFRACRRDLKLLISLMMVPTIVLVIGKLGTTWGAREYMQLLSQGESILQIQPYILPSCILLLGTLISYFALFWLLLRQLGYVRMILLGTSDLKQEIAQVKKEKWRILLYIITSFVGFFVWCFGVGIFAGIALALINKAVLPAILSVPFFVFALVVSFAALLVMFLPLVLVFLVLVMEGRGFFGTFSRSMGLSFRNFGKVLGFLLLSYLCITLVSFALQSPYQIFYLFHYFKSLSAGAESYANSPLLTVPLYLQMLALVWQSCICIYTYPVLFLGAGHVYYSIRMKEDGIDILSDLDKISGKTIADQAF